MKLGRRAGDTTPRKPPFPWRQLAPRHRLLAIAKTPLLIAAGAYLAGGAVNGPGVWLSLGIASALWSVLYALNEVTDAALEAEAMGGECVGRWLIVASAALITVAGCVSARLLALLALMAASQFSYCLPPLRLKRWWISHLFLSGAVNPLTRLHCGAIWGLAPVPGLAYGVLLSLHLGAAIRTRTLQRERDLHLSYTAPPHGAELIGMGCTALGILGAYRLCSQALLPPALAPLVTVGAAFAAYAWTRRDLSMAQLRRSWTPFAILSLVVLWTLLRQPPSPPRSAVDPPPPLLTNPSPRP